MEIGLKREIVPAQLDELRPNKALQKIFDNVFEEFDEMSS